MARKTTRRKFLGTSAAIGAGFWVAGGVAPRESRAAVEKIHFASVGVPGATINISTFECATG